MTITRNRNSSFRNRGRRNSAGRNSRAVNKGFDLNGLINKPKKQVTTPEHQVNRTFAEMNLVNELESNLTARGFSKPTPIQDQTFEAIMESRDVLGIANTGTGKTAAFLMPLIQQLLSGEDFQTLIVVPTRELAQQVQAEFSLLTRGMKIYSTCLIGGTNVGADIRQLNRKSQMIIGTPGRLLDMAKRRALKLEKIEVLVLDEFDRMLDMGFVNDVKFITEAMKQRRQTLLFSATEEANQKRLISEILNQPVKVQISSGKSVSDQVTQETIAVKGRDKTQLLIDMILNDELPKVLVFAETKRQVDKLAKKLSQASITTGLIHGNKTQGQRNKALNSFKKSLTRVLVATDVAARGIDIADISHVINFEMPRTLDSYIHRIGRTGRAGNVGTAITLID